MFLVLPCHLGALNLSTGILVAKKDDEVAAIDHLKFGQINDSVFERIIQQQCVRMRSSAYSADFFTIAWIHWPRRMPSVSMCMTILLAPPVASS